MLQASGLARTLIRPSHVDRNLSGVFASDIRHRDRDRVMVPAGGSRIAFVDTHDVAAAAAAALLDPAGHTGRMRTRPARL